LNKPLIRPLATTMNREAASRPPISRAAREQETRLPKTADA
jgi:hypothetical protein